MVEGKGTEHSPSDPRRNNLALHHAKQDSAKRVLGFGGDRDAFKSLSTAKRCRDPVSSGITRGVSEQMQTLLPKTSYGRVRAFKHVTVSRL